MGERKRLKRKQGRDPLHGAKPAVILESGKVPAVQLTTTDNTTQPTLLWEAAARRPESRSLLGCL